MGQEEQKNIWRKAMDLLARREHSRYELRLKLQKHASLTVINEVINALEVKQILSENRYVEMIVRTYSNKGYGPRFIEHKLLQQQISKTVAGQALLQSGHDWCEAAKKQRIKHFGSVISEDRKIRWKQMKYLQNRGFLPEQIKEAFQTVDSA